MRVRGWIWLLALALMAGIAGLRRPPGGAVETDLLAMLPATEQNPVAETALRSLAKATGDRAMFLVSAGDASRSKAAALKLGTFLAASGAFGQVQTTLPPIDPGVTTRFYLPHRFRLAGPAGPETEGELAERIQARLASPRLGAVPAAQDPLGDLEGFLSALPMGGMHMDVEDDLLVIRGPAALHVLVSGTLKGSAFDPAVQKDVAGAVRAGEADLHRAFPEARLLRTGTVFYAADARDSATREVNLVSGCSTLFIVVLYLWTFRSLRHLLLGMACVGAGFVAAASICLLVFGRLYLLTLVCGSSVIGVAVDYSFLYFASHLGAGPDWKPRPALARILPALAVGLATTLLGYAALFLAPFPGLRQMAVFSMVGLAGAFLTVLCVLPDLLVRPIPPRPRLMAAMGCVLLRAIGWARSPRTWILLGCATLLLALAATRMRVDDDVLGLIRPSRALLAEEAGIQALTGLSNTGAFFLVEGAGEAEVLSREEALRERLARLGLEGVQSVSAFVPSPAAQEAHLRANRDRAPRLARALRTAGFRPGVAPALEADLEASRPLTVAQWFSIPLSVPYRMLWLGPTAHGMGSIVYPLGAPRTEALRSAAAGLEGVTCVDKAHSVTRLLAHYRRVASWALGGAVLLVGLALALLYGLRPGLAALVPALGGILLAMAGVGLAGVPVTLFTVLALILVLGFGVDYAVFLRAGGHRDPSALLGVLLAGMATLMSYGLLVLSHTPALAGFALALALGVLGSLLASFLALGPRGTCP